MIFVMIPVKKLIDQLNEKVAAVEKTIDELYAYIRSRYLSDDKERIMRYTMYLKDYHQFLTLKDFDILNSHVSSHLIEIHSFIVCYLESSHQKYDLTELIGWFVKTCNLFFLRFRTAEGKDYCLEEEFRSSLQDYWTE